LKSGLLEADRLISVEESLVAFIKQSNSEIEIPRKEVVYQQLKYWIDQLMTWDDHRCVKRSAHLG
jgi:hypothetical protein